MLSKLREALSRRRKKRVTENGLTPSAVLLPIYNKEGRCHILFTQRTENVKEHKGQISFPGGARQYGESLRDTALRESQEEIGLAPFDVEIIGELDDTATAVSNRVSRRQANRWANQAPAQPPPPQYAEPAPQYAAPAPAPAPASAGPGDDMLAQLEKLGQLHEAGVHTDAEFAEQKARILGA